MKVASAVNVVVVPVLVVMIGAALIGGGCKSTHEEGVSSNMRTQWVTVNANTEAATKAAEAVLKDEGLKEVTSTATAMDGMAKGKKAEGTEVKVEVQKLTDSSSKVSVTVGTMGEPSVGAEIAKKTKMKAEAK